jgi:hypothetical protein
MAFCEVAKKAAANPKNKNTDGDPPDVHDP